MGNDRRTAGVLVHHVATMYPIEIDVARSVGSGKAVTDITWEVVAQFNAKHAEEKAAVTKAEALELLHQNSRKASEAVREFTDEELDRAAAFSLSCARRSLRSSLLKTINYATDGTTCGEYAGPLGR